MEHTTRSNISWNRIGNHALSRNRIGNHALSRNSIGNHALGFGEYAEIAEE